MERAVAYARGALVTTTHGHLCLPTPCEKWRLGDLLAHMEDSLDAFIEGADGRIGPSDLGPDTVARSLSRDPVATLQTKACHLLGAWTAHPPAEVRIGSGGVAVDTLARIAALEIAVHGWDVAQTTGHVGALPPALASDLLPTALDVALDRYGEFAPPLRVGRDAGPERRLLALLGRRPVEHS